MRIHLLIQQLQNTKQHLLRCIKEGLGVMDSTASSLCMDNDIPLIVFSVMEKR